MLGLPTAVRRYLCDTPRAPGPPISTVAPLVATRYRSRPRRRGQRVPLLLVEARV